MQSVLLERLLGPSESFSVMAYLHGIFGHPFSYLRGRFDIECDGNLEDVVLKEK